MLGRTGWYVLSFAGGVLLACAGPGLPDGSLCEPGERCASGKCQEAGFDCTSGSCREQGYCPGSGCSDNDDCEPNWSCERIQTHEATFLGILDDDEYAYLCIPQCEPCPENFRCDGSSCVFDPDWAPEGAPVVEINAPAEIGAGMTTTLHAFATSPTGAEIASHVWYFHDGSQAQGDAIERAFTPAEAITREEEFSDFFYATVEVTDVQGNVGSHTAEIRRCGAAGEACEDSYDCCSGLLTCTPTADPNDEPGHGSCEPYQE